MTAKASKRNNDFGERIGATPTPQPVTEPVAGWAPDGSFTYDSGGIKINIPPDFMNEIAVGQPINANSLGVEDGQPITAKAFHDSVSEQLEKRVQDLYNKKQAASTKVEAATDMGLGKAVETLNDALVDRLGQIDKRLSDMDTKLNQVSNKQVTSQHNQPNVRILFDEQDMREFEELLDRLEKSAATLPRGVTTFPITPQELRVGDDIGIDVNTLNKMFDNSLNVEHFDGDPEDILERDYIMAKNRTGWVTEPDGTQKHYTKDGVLHCDSGPAEVRPNGTQLYYKQGSLHRDGGLPAMVGARGTEKFAVNGKYHRLGGLPAITWSKGPYRFEYWTQGEITSAQKKDGTKEYYAPGCTDRDEAILSRTDGPAVIHPNGREEFWINGTQFGNRDQWISALERMNNMRELDRELDNGLIDEDPIEALDEEQAPTVRTAKKAQEKTKMDKPSFTDKLKANAVSAGYRVAGTQLTTLIKNAILTVMRNKGADGGAIAAFSTFLDSEFGNAMISFAIGSGLQYVPIESLREDERVIRLAEEMSVAGMAIAGNAVIGEAMNHVLPAVSQILQNLPSADGSASNVRVIESNETSQLAKAMEEEEDAEESETTAPAKTMKA